MNNHRLNTAFTNRSMGLMYGVLIMLPQHWWCYILLTAVYLSVCIWMDYTMRPVLCYDVEVSEVHTEPKHYAKLLLRDGSRDDGNTVCFISFDGDGLKPGMKAELSIIT